MGLSIKHTIFFFLFLFKHAFIKDKIIKESFFFSYSTLLSHPLLYSLLSFLKPFDDNKT